MLCPIVTRWSNCRVIQCRLSTLSSRKGWHISAHGSRIFGYPLYRSLTRRTYGPTAVHGAIELNMYLRIRRTYGPTVIPRVTAQIGHLLR